MYTKIGPEHCASHRLLSSQEETDLSRQSEPDNESHAEFTEDETT